MIKVSKYIDLEKPPLEVDIEKQIQEEFQARVHKELLGKKLSRELLFEAINKVTTDMQNAMGIPDFSSQPPSGEFLDRWANDMCAIQRMVLPEEHPDAVRDPFTGDFMESDDALRKRVFQAHENMHKKCDI